MTPTQAADFASRWTVVATPYNDLVTGVYAVVFQEIATGKKTLAIRGTQGATDYLADYFILNGVPPQLNPQYQSLKTKVAAWLGDGTLVPGFTVSGHSLGGYLAAGLVADFSASIDHAYLYNAPGNNSLVTQIMQALGITPTPDAAKITSLRADEGISPIAELGNDFSTPIPIHIENQLDPSLILTAPLAMNHSQQVLTDSLAVYNLLAKIDPAISTDAITGILKASSNGAANTLESTLAALGKIFGKTYTTGQTTRDILYDNLQDLQAAASSAGAGTLTVTSLASKTASEIAAQARQDTPEGLACRYALEQLNPFAVTGNDSLYAAHNATGKLDLYHPASGTGSLTDLYLADRAAMLAWKMQFDTTDKSYSLDWNTDTVSGNWDFIDQGTLINGSPLQLAIDGRGVTLYDHQIIFGDSSSNILTGSGDSDHLYGGGGGDTLTGGNGADHLEGGTGADTYLINSGDGNDTILDTDGQGSIVYNGTTLTGGTKIGTNTWRGANNISYTLFTSGSTQNLLIDTGAERFTVKDFTSGELGIALPGAPSLPPGQTSVGFNISGDLAPLQMPWDYYLWLAYPTWPYLFDVNGNLVRSTTPQPYFADKIFDSAGDDNISAGHGFNVIYAMKGGNNYIESGNNDDYIVGGSGRDVVSAGGMSDTIDVAGGNDIVYGQDGGDVVEGGTGNDYLAGGNGADALNGGEGDDQVFGSDPIAWQDAVVEDDTGVSGQGELLAGGDGNDLVVGSQTGDALVGGTGQDQLAGRAGDDILLGDSGLDFVVPPLSEFDMIIGTTNWPVGAYNNFHSPYTTAPMLNLQFQRIDHGVGAENRFEVKLSSAANPEASRDNWAIAPISGGNDELYGGAGNDWLFGEFGDDTLVGGSGDDVLVGGADRDTLFGGENTDTLVGGAGNDTYIFNAGDGNDIIVDSSSGGETNTLLFGAGFDPAQVTLFQGSLGLDMGNGDIIHIEGVDYDNIADTSSIQRFEFADGTVLTVQELLARGFEVNGGDGDDILQGTGVADRIDGGTGNDTLQGGTGNDVYLFGRGSGQDTIVEHDATTDNLDTIRLAAGIAVADVTLSRDRFQSVSRNRRHHG